MRRGQVKSKCCNPLFVQWLEEWKSEAVLKDSQMQYCFTKAIRSLQKYPLPLESGRDCIILQHFGAKLCTMLDKKLSEYRAGLGHNGNRNNENANLNVDLQNEQNDVGNVNRENKRPTDKLARKKSKELIPAKKSKISEAKDNSDSAIDNQGKKEKRSSSGPYVPEWRSGGYAILLTLYEKSKNPQYIGYITKMDLQADAQKYSDASFTKPDPGTYYSAWSSMRTLINKGLVIKSSCPARYGLTDAGYAIAVHLSDLNKTDDFAQPLLSIYSPSCSTKISQGTIRSAVKNAVGLKSCSPAIDEQEKNQMQWCYEDDEILGHVEENNSSAKQRKANNLQGQMVETQRTDEIITNSIYLTSGTFDVILLVDNRETSGGPIQPKDDLTIAELSHMKVPFEVRHLKIGDFAWIARCKNSGTELILPYIVERKRMDDFAGSIKDGRYYEQKFRLKKCGIQYITYLIEKHGNNQHLGLPLSTLLQAATNTLVQNGFTVKHTNSHKDSMLYLASMTVLLTKTYQKRSLIGCNEDLIPSDPRNDVLHLMVFNVFNKAAGKVKKFKVKEMFIRHLVQLKGMSVDKALAIVELYPSPVALRRSYEKAGPSAENLLASIQFGATKRTLGAALSKTLHQFYTKKDFCVL